MTAVERALPQCFSRYEHSVCDRKASLGTNEIFLQSSGNIGVKLTGWDDQHENLEASLKIASTPKMLTKTAVFFSF